MKTVDRGVSLEASGHMNLSSAAVQFVQSVPVVQNVLNHLNSLNILNSVWYLGCSPAVRNCEYPVDYKLFSLRATLSIRTRRVGRSIRRD